eukprot:1137501-Pelagomonas_calceolata.AAC.1
MFCLNCDGIPKSTYPDKLDQLVTHVRENHFAALQETRGENDRELQAMYTTVYMTLFKGRVVLEQSTTPSLANRVN